MAFKQVTIIGTGLIGGSLGLALKTVSYTHLDVYKRQVPEHMEKVGVFVDETADNVRDAVKQAALTSCLLYTSPWSSPGVVQSLTTLKR